MNQAFKPLSILAARAADEKKGESIRLLDMRKKGGLADFILLINILSPAHLDGLGQEIEAVMKSSGVRLLHWDRSESALWRVLDYGGLMVHLLDERAREFYQIDKLFSGGAAVRWQETPKPRGKELAAKSAR